MVLLQAGFFSQQGLSLQSVSLIQKLIFCAVLSLRLCKEHSESSKALICFMVSVSNKSYKCGRLCETLQRVVLSTKEESNSQA